MVQAIRSIQIFPTGPRLRQAMGSLNPGWSALGVGSRVTFAMLTPIVGGHLLGDNRFSFSAVIGALMVSLADPGGAYRTRATWMLVAIVSIVLTAIMAGLAVDPSWLTVLAVVLFTFISTMLGMYGAPATKLGLVTSLVFVLVLLIPAPEVTPVERAVSLGVGGLLAMVLAIALWPIRPYAPAIKAMATGYRNLATLLSEIAEIDVKSARQKAGWENEIAHERIALQTTIQELQTVVIASRSERTGRSPVDDNLLMLLRRLVTLAGEATALTEALASMAGGSDNLSDSEITIRAIQQAAKVADDIAKAIEVGGWSVETQALDENIQDIESSIETIRDSDDVDGDLPNAINLREIEQILQSIAQDLAAASELAENLTARSVEEPVQPRGRDPFRTALQQKLATFWANLSFDSMIMRYALRVGITTGVAVAISLLLDLEHGVWIAITVLMVMKPDFGGSRQTAIDRTVATFLGGIAAALLVAVFRNEDILFVLVAIFGVLTFAELTVNYRRAIFSLTVFLIVLLNLADPGNWELAISRVLNTAVGGGLAFVAGYLLWPVWMRALLPDQIAQAIAANRVYFQTVSEGYWGTTDPVQSREKRRNASLKLANARITFQRSLSDPGPRHDDTEPLYALVVANGRFEDGVTALEEHLKSFSGEHQLPGFKALATQLEDIMSDLEQVIGDNTAPKLLPDLNSSVNQLKTHIAELLRKRSEEIKAEQLDTPTREAGLDFNVVVIELERLVNDVQTMHHAVVQINVGANAASTPLVATTDTLSTTTAPSS